MTTKTGPRRRRTVDAVTMQSLQDYVAFLARDGIEFLGSHEVVADRILEATRWGERIAEQMPQEEWGRYEQLRAAVTADR